MALIKCGDCGRDVSSSATSCPGCGRPIATGIVEKDAADRSQSRWMKTVGFILVLGGLGGACASLGGSGSAVTIGVVAFGLGFVIFIVGRLRE